MKTNSNKQHVLYVFAIITVVLVFFWKFIAHGLLPIPSDSLVGLYHPFRDFYSAEYPNGMPYKNFLITDPVRQQYPWRYFSIEQLQSGSIPTWNPYQFAGTPHLANLQSAAFYPLNLLFFIIPFQTAWSLLVLLQPLLGALFMYLFLNSFKLRKEASFLGAITYAFSGFSVAWLSWNTVGHVGLWLPLGLYCINRITDAKKPLKRVSVLFILLFVFSVISSAFAGHAQVLFYSGILIGFYGLAKVFANRRVRSAPRSFIILGGIAVTSVLISAAQWLPMFQLIANSSRSINSKLWLQEGWFIPYQHLTQFIAPDFFGNPTTLNYWGVWNYGELVGYVGIAGLLLSLFALFDRRDKKTLFFGSFFFVALLFATPTILAKIPFQLNIPLLSTSQPTRLLFIIDFSLAALAALGFDRLLSGKLHKRIAIGTISILSVVIAFFWGFAYFGESLLTGENIAQNLAVTTSNLKLPTLLYVSISILLLTYVSTSKKYLNQEKGIKKYFGKGLILALLLLACLDLLRFGWKFTPFTDSQYLFPQTKALSFLSQQEGVFRIMTTDNRLLPPNASMQYKLQSVDGYDPLYVSSYGEFASAWVRGEPDISPFQFNRIITPQNYDHRFADLLNVKYILSLDEINEDQYVKVFEEGDTKVYENLGSFPRAFFVEHAVTAKDKQEVIDHMYDTSINLSTTAIIANPLPLNIATLAEGERVTIESYESEEVVLIAVAHVSRLLVLTDVYYPSWRVYIDGTESMIHRVNYAFRGVIVPKGEHEVVFSNKIL